MNYYEQLRHGFTQEPIIVTGAAGSYVIIGSHDHGVQILPTAIPKLLDTLGQVKALKMEGEGMEEAFKRFHPLSVELLAKASVDQSRFSWISESDGEDLGRKLTRYGVSEGVMEVYVPTVSIRLHHGVVSNNFFRSLPQLFEYYKPRFGFLNAEHGTESFMKVLDYWERNRLNPVDLMDFSFDFEGFMGIVREFEYWKPDLTRFRADHRGKIAVCAGMFHVPFVQSVLEGKEIERPDWPNHMDKSTNPLIVERGTSLRETYRNIEIALDETT